MQWLEASEGIEPKLDAMWTSSALQEIKQTLGAGKQAKTLIAWRTSPWLPMARWWARRASLPLLVLDDGLLRGPSGWSPKAPVISMIPVEVSAPGSAERLRRTEQLLQSGGWESPSLLARARAGILSLSEARLGGDCWAADGGASARRLLENASTVVVLNDEQDPLLPPFRAHRESLQRMLKAVSVDHDPEKVIVVAPSAPGRRTAWRRVAAVAASQGWRLIEQPTSPWTVLDGARHVYTLGHEIGFLALLRGLDVHCFGRPFYAGWGLTEDDPSIQPRARRRSLEEIFAAECLLATRYRNPLTARPCNFEEACAQLVDWHRANEANRRVAVCLGMAYSKRRAMKDFFRSSDGVPAFCRSTTRAVAAARRRRGAIAVWASREPAGLAATAAASDVPVLRVEDGFIRSVGLGANFVPAASIVADGRGMYFDPSSASDLEVILNETDFDPALIARARGLRQTLVERRITKYNVGAALPRSLLPAAGRRLFVPGQVEDDRSVLLGGAGIGKNLDLLARVRRDNPDAFIVYQPHPDVDAALRRGGVADTEALRFADRIVRGLSSVAIGMAVDEIHTLCSLVGFEGLLRGRRVVVYGQPFYAGWGLTVDRVPLQRRRRRLSLDELVAGALILYPRYLDPLTRLPCGPETVVERLSRRELWRPKRFVRLRHLHGAVMGAIMGAITRRSQRGAERSAAEARP